MIIIESSPGSLGHGHGRGRLAPGLQIAERGKPPIAGQSPRRPPRVQDPSRSLRRRPTVVDSPSTVT